MTKKRDKPPEKPEAGGITEITLAELAGGALGERFGLGFSKLLKNILDPNTPATAKRAVQMTVTVVPSKDRKRAQLVLDVSTKLAAHSPVAVDVFLGQTADGVKAVTFDPGQLDTFRTDDESGGDILPIDSKLDTGS